VVAGVARLRVVTPGQEITVKVLRVDEQPERIALGLKQLMPIPGRRSRRGTRWARCVWPYHAPCGVRAFVELEPGIEALAHASTFARPGTRALDAHRVGGHDGGFEILSLDLAKKRSASRSCWKARRNEMRQRPRRR